MRTKSNNKTGIYTGSLLVCFVMSFAAQAQQARDVENIVMYDPLFWKEQLKLKDAQCRLIQDINAEYYENLKKVFYDYSQDRSAMQARAVQYLEQRSRKIWNIFHPNQRRKWKRMWDHHYATRGKYSEELTSSLAKPPFLDQL